MFKPAFLSAAKSGKSQKGWRLLVNVLAKALILSGICWVFYYQIVQRQDIGEIQVAFRNSFAESSRFLLFAALALVPLNWLAETYKWKMLLDNFTNNAPANLYRAVMAGITVSLFTPNRIGEYGGRVLFLAPKFRWRATMATLAGSFAQLIVLIGFGLIALGLFSLQYLALNSWLVLGAAILSGLMLLFLLLSYFNLDIMDRLLSRLPDWAWLEKARTPIAYLGEFSTHSLISSLSFAGLRYGIYGLQYYLMASFFGISIQPYEAFMVIGSIFLLQTSIPLPPIWSLLVRGQVALYFWGFFCTNPILILAATFGLWVINLILPALVGMVFLLFLNIPESLGYETKEN